MTLSNLFAWLLLVISKPPKPIKPCATTIHYVIIPLLAVADGPPSSNDQQNETAPFKLEATVPSRLALGVRCGYGQRCWGSPVRQKKKHTGNWFCINVLCLFHTGSKHHTIAFPCRLFDDMKEVYLTSQVCAVPLLFGKIINLLLVDLLCHQFPISLWH